MTKRKLILYKEKRKEEERWEGGGAHIEMVPGGGEREGERTFGRDDLRDASFGGDGRDALDVREGVPEFLCGGVKHGTLGHGGAAGALLMLDGGAKRALQLSFVVPRVVARGELGGGPGLSLGAPLGRGRRCHRALLMGGSCLSLPSSQV